MFNFIIGLILGGIIGIALMSLIVMSKEEKK